MDTAGRDEHPAFTAATAEELAVTVLAGLTTRLGGSQIAHARRVAAAVRATEDDRAVAAALLHDVVEKGSISLDELLNRSHDRRLVDLIDLLTHRDDEPDGRYLARCAADPVALAIKRADLIDKLDADDAQVDEQTAHQLRSQARARLELLDTLARGPGRGSPRSKIPDLLQAEPLDGAQSWSSAALIEAPAQLRELDRLRACGLLTADELERQRRAVADG